MEKMPVFHLNTQPHTWMQMQHTPTLIYLNRPRKGLQSIFALGTHNSMLITRSVV